MKYYLGIDLGGTNVRVAKVDEEGNVLNDIISPSHGLEGPDVIVNNIISIIEQFDLSDVKGIGLAIPGPVDAERNVISQSTNIPGCEDYPFADIIQNKFNIPVVLDNDANAAGLAEAMFGAGKDYKSVYYITHSTGIGGALIIDKHLINGHKGYAGEVANIIVDAGAERPNRYSHLNAGSVESVASGTAIGMQGEKAIGPDASNAKEVFAFARKGDERALKIVDDAVFHLSIMLGAISCVCAPDCFVIGGGCSKDQDVYFDKVRYHFHSLVHKHLQDVPVIPAELKEPGVVGAAMLAKQKES